MSNNRFKGVTGWIVAVICFVLISLFIAVVPAGRALVNKWAYSLHKVDEKTYENQKEVEDTLRAYRASYEVDKTTYLAYKDSTDKYELALAKSAKVRLIETASYYNEFFTKNSFMWGDNKPEDLPDKLDIDF